jgi:endothelin-converting enzyme/putative endopeptidase
LKDYFAGIGFTKLDTVIVSQPKYMKAFLSENNFCMERIYEVDFIKRFNGFLSRQSMQLILILWKDIKRTIKQRPLEELCKQLMEPSVKQIIC